MRLSRFFIQFIFWGLLGIQNVSASVESIKQPFSPTNASQANWLFAGTVTSEKGGVYGYFFKVQRQLNTIHVTTALIDEDNKALLSLDDGTVEFNELKAHNWKVGCSFIKFNPINGNWIFGLKTKDKKGFNFKVDMLTGVKNPPIVRELRPGVDLLIGQTSQLNGHIYFGHEEKEQFVTASNTWFRQIWLSKAENQQDLHHVSGVLCRELDGGGFYSVNMHESHIHQGAITGLFDERGESQPISQFIDIQKNASDDRWHIRVQTPKYHIAMQNRVPYSETIADFVSFENKPSFCVISKDLLEDKKQIGFSRSS